MIVSISITRARSVFKRENMALGSTTQASRFRSLFWVLLCYMIPTGSGNLDWVIRLDGSQLSTEGRIEVFLDGQWGTITNINTWGYNEVSVVCKQLGFHGKQVAVLGGGYYGRGSGPVHLANVKCREEATSLEQCSHVQVKGEYIDHEFDVAITCDAAIRLKGSRTSGNFLNGIVQVYTNEWITLCTSYWTSANSKVACRRLGYPVGRASSIRVPETLTSVYRRDYQCTGNEWALEECPNNVNNLTSCQSQVPYINCSNVETSSPSYDKSSFTLSTISGSIVFLVIIIMVLLGYLVSVRKRSSRHRRWITLANGRQQDRPSETERRRRRRRRSGRVRRGTQRRQAPNVNTISNGQQGNDLPPYSRLEEDIPPPYSQLSLPRIEIPVVGREERYTEQPPRYTETDALDFFQELDADQLRLQYENRADAERLAARCGQQSPPDYSTAVESPQMNTQSVSQHNELETISLQGPSSSGDEGDDISLSGCRNPIPIIPKDMVNMDATVTSVEV
ncbi:lysyl oxidase homolog 2-like [Lytechinus variegatus]|uniref:lysyl oxidase homolog 2-like n=1 Tax=Lytechinus variegatus TaxID=7654 RepID=UPI001BB1A5A7|nr:lysyl oxidase homolog 2-like [Lytechinus variegatus]